MGCHEPSRRTVLTALAAAAALPVGGFGLLASRSLSMTARDLEIATVSDQSVAVSWTTAAADPVGRWRPVAADTEFALGPADSRKSLRVVHTDSTPTAFHYVEIGGLEPGRPYRLEARSRGVRAVSGSTTRWWNDEHRHEFRTLVPPPGRLGCSCTTVVIRTATAVPAPTLPSRSNSWRWPPSRNIPPVTRCCGCTRADTWSPSKPPARPPPGVGAPVPGPSCSGCSHATVWAHSPTETMWCAAI